MKTFYCKNCKKILLKGNFADIEIICRGCKELNIIRYVSASRLLTFELPDEIITTESTETA